MEEMTVTLDTVNDIRSMDAAGRSRSEIDRALHVSQNTVANYPNMEDMSPAAPMPQRRGRHDEFSGIVAAAVGLPACRPLVALGPDELGRLLVKRRVEHLLDGLPHQILYVLTQRLLVD